jgi:CO/xanthine dehydrogenase FAD-binding subunit
MSYHAPTTLEQAWPLLADGKTRIVAGGTDLYPAIGDGLPPGSILDVTRIEGLRGVTRDGGDGGGWRFGGATTWSDVIAAPLPPAFDGLKAAAREVGSVQIQNAGTLAGNLCNASPAADGVPPLLTLAAEVELASAKGVRRLPLADFLTGVRQTARRPDEVLTSLVIPDAPAGAGSSFVKLGSRRFLVISIAMVAAVVWLDGTGRIAGLRVAVGACSPVAQRLFGLEQSLVTCDPADLAGLSFPRDAFDSLSPIDDVRGSAGYRRDVLEPLVRKALAQAAGMADE